MDSAAHIISPRHFTRTILFFYLVILLLACNNQKKIAKPVSTATGDPGIFIYYNRGAISEYRRNFTVTVTPIRTHLLVEDYEKVVLKDSFALDPVTYRSFAKSLDSLQIRNRPEIKGPVCTGGHLEKFTLHAGSKKEVKGWANFCGGQQNGDLEGDLMTAIKLFYTIIPNLFEIIDGTIKDD